MKFNLKNLVFYCSCIIGLIIYSMNVFAGDMKFLKGREALINELSSRHPSMSIQSLSEMMGSEDSLVNELLDLRRLDKPPFIGPRAEKLLLSFSHMEKVQEALLDDIQDPSFFGLGSVILSSYKLIKDENFKLRVLEAAKSRSKNNDQFSKRYQAIIEEIEESSD